MTRHGFPMLAAALAVVTAASPALGAGGCRYGERHGGWAMHRLDLNGDGAITKPETAALRTVQFLRWGGNGDGRISEDELVAAEQRGMARRGAKRFARMDRNGDGRIEQAEVDAFAAERFAFWDTDSDGVVTGDEVRARRHEWRRRGVQGRSGKASPGD